MWHLERVLAKKRDPLSHVLFLDALKEGEASSLPLTFFWCAPYCLEALQIKKAARQWQLEEGEKTNAGGNTELLRSSL